MKLVISFVVLYTVKYFIFFYSCNYYRTRLNSNYLIYYQVEIAGTDLIIFCTYSKYCYYIHILLVNIIKYCIFC